jgi:cell division transport system ATP-binding protein
MVEFKNVSKSYGAITALSDVSFAIEEGECVFVVGGTGAGKTTILKLLLAQVRPTTGEIVVGDTQVHKIKRGQIPKYRQKIGMVFQDYRLLPERTVKENIEVALAVKNINQKEWPARVTQILELVGLKNREDLFPSQLSGGELQRVSLARALVVSPSVILADEPTGNLDVKTGEAIMELMMRINQEGKTLIITSHNTHLVEKYAKRIIEIQEGKLVKDHRVKGKK